MNRATAIGLGLVVTSLAITIYPSPTLQPVWAFLAGCICLAIGDERKGSDV